MARLLESKQHPEQGYRSCLGLFRLSKDYPKERFEAAVSRALTIGTLSMHSVKSILKHSLDQTTLPLFEPEEQPAAAHENLRGAGCYQDATTTKRGSCTESNGAGLGVRSAPAFT